MAFHRRTRRLRSEINLTPLIDVMTSLLAIFMITAPMLTTGIPLNLPKGDGKQVQEDDKTLDIGINEKGEIFLGENQVSYQEFLPKIKAIVGENPKIRMMISADKKAEYGLVVEVMALLRSAGYTQVGLRTDTAKIKELSPR